MRLRSSFLATAAVAAAFGSTVLPGSGACPLRVRTSAPPNANGTYFSLLKIEARAQVLELAVGRLAKD